MAKTANLSGMRVSQIIESLVSELTVYARSLERNVNDAEFQLLTTGNSMTEYEVSTNISSIAIRKYSIKF